MPNRMMNAKEELRKQESRLVTLRSSNRIKVVQKKLYTLSLSFSLVSLTWFIWLLLKKRKNQYFDL